MEIYCYFISYKYQTRFQSLVEHVDNCEFQLNHPIKSMEQITEIENKILDELNIKYDDFKNVKIINYKLLRVEE
jgi:hypothetical protein